LIKNTIDNTTSCQEDKGGESFHLQKWENKNRIKDAAPYRKKNAQKQEIKEKGKGKQGSGIN